MYQTPSVKYIKQSSTRQARKLRKHGRFRFQHSLDETRMPPNDVAGNLNMLGLESKCFQLEKGQNSTTLNHTENINMSKGNLMRLRAMECGSLDEQTDARLLFSAIRKGKIRLAKFILDAASKDIVDAKDIRGKSPLAIACFMKEELSRDAMVNLILSYNADVNALDDDGRTALSFACERRCNTVVRTLVQQATIEPDIPDNKGNTALMYSAKVGNDVAIDILTRRFRRLGLAVDHINKEGLTALLMAAKHGFITCTKLLIERGHASVLHRDAADGYSVEEWLLKNGYTWEDIVPLMAKSHPRSRFVRAIHVARFSTTAAWPKLKSSPGTLTEGHSSSGHKSSSKHNSHYPQPPAQQHLHRSGNQNMAAGNHLSKRVTDSTGTSSRRRKSGIDMTAERHNLQKTQSLSDITNRKIDRLQLPKIHVTGAQEYANVFRNDTDATSTSPDTEEDDIYEDVVNVNDIQDPGTNTRFRPRIRSTKSQRTIEEYLTDESSTCKETDY